MQEVETSVQEVSGKLEETKIADQLQDAALTDVTQGEFIHQLFIQCHCSLNRKSVNPYLFWKIPVTLLIMHNPLS